MTEYIAGLICAFVLAALLVAWFAYCMFVRERHKDHVQYNISDIIKRNEIIAELEGTEEKCEQKTGLGVFILPSRHKYKGHKEVKEKDEYDKRPDYPEGPVPLELSTEKLVELFHESANDNDFYKDGTLEIGSNATYISDV